VKEADINALRDEIVKSLGDTTDIEGTYKAVLSRFQDLDATCAKIEARCLQGSSRRE
jgi:hypothetical protein